MYSYNSTHKIFVVLIVVAWAIYHFSGKNTDRLIYENGQAKRVGEQKNSLNDGVWVWYYENGETQMKGEFIEGKRTGIWEQYDSLGNLLSTSQYRENHINGLLTKYRTDGTIREQYIYRNDTVVKKVELK